MPPKQQAAFPGHPIKCPSCYGMIYVSCTRCKGFGQVQVHNVDVSKGRTKMTTRRAAVGMQQKDGEIGMNGSAASAEGKK